MLTNIDLEKMNHLMETNKDAKEIITQLLKNHDAAVATIAHEIRNPMTVLYSFHAINGLSLCRNCQRLLCLGRMHGWCQTYV